MPDVAYFTVCSNNYVSQAITLMKSLDKKNPGANLHIFLVDRIVDEVIMLKNQTCPKVSLHQIEDLDLDFLGDMILRYGILELNTALKPFCFSWLFDQFDYASVCYLDPDIVVYTKLTEVDIFADSSSSVLLTPHSLKPLLDQRVPNDYHFLQSGTFNLGFICINNVAEGRTFLNWWELKLKDQCVADFSINLFTDQKWCDLIPSYFPGHQILRHEGYNVAYWNLSNRQMRFVERKYMVNDHELRFIHFSGLDIPGLTFISKHQNRLTWGQVEEFKSLAKQYVNELLLNSWEVTRSLDYFFSRTISGRKILPIYQQYFRHCSPISIILKYEKLDEFIDHMLTNPCEHIEIAFKSDISEFQHWLWQSRPDLQVTFDLSKENSCQSYLEWFSISFQREYGLDTSISKVNRPPFFLANLVVRLLILLSRKASNYKKRLLKEGN